MSVFFSYNIFLKQKSAILLQVSLEYKTINHHHLGKEFESVFPHISGLVMKAAYNTFKKLEIMVPWNNICFCEFNKNFANLSSAISWFIMKPFIKKLKELFFCGVIYSLGVRITSFCSKYILNNIG